jgi:[ribosomal protein S5]-alanine N-acetyltransferase
VIICESDRLTLRHLDAQNDAPFILRLLNEPSFIQNIGDRNVRTLDDARRYIETGPRAMYAQHGFGLFRTELKTTGEPIGMCGLLKRDWLADADIGFAFFPQFWSQGYAFESAAAVIEWAREHKGLTRVVAITAPENHGSQRVLAKLGLKFTGTVYSPEGQESSLFTPDQGLARNM